VHARTFEILAGSDGLQVEVPADCAFIDGHFPGAPIVPGAALLQLVLRHAWAPTDGPVRIRRLRFSLPVRPGARLTLVVERKDGTVQFALRDGSEPVMHGTLSPRGVEA